MNDFRRCAICGEFGWFDTKYVSHTCAPRWECRMEWNAADNDGWGIIHATDAEQAAEKYAEHYDCEGGEYAIVSRRSRSDAIVQVRKPKEDDSDDEPPFESFAIEAETVPQYHATKLGV
jgi:hypothetical protein